MKIFITGGDGILGNNLIRILIDCGHEVKVFIENGKEAGSRLLLNLCCNKQKASALYYFTDICTLFQTQKPNIQYSKYGATQKQRRPHLY